MLAVVNRAGGGVLDGLLFWASLVLFGLLFVGVSLDMVLTVLDIRSKRRDADERSESNKE